MEDTSQGRMVRTLEESQAELMRLSWLSFGSVNTLSGECLKWVNNGNLEVNKCLPVCPQADSAQ